MVAFGGRQAAHRANRHGPPEMRACVGRLLPPSSGFRSGASGSSRPIAVGRRPIIAGGKLTLRRYNICYGDSVRVAQRRSILCDRREESISAVAIATSFTFASNHHLDVAFCSNAVVGYGFADEVDLLRSHHCFRLCFSVCGKTRNYPQVPTSAHIWCENNFQYGRQ